jgi:hypothetical protein
VEEYDDQGEGVAEEDEDRDVALPRSQTRRQKYIARRKRERPAFSDEEDDWFLENEDDESEDEEYALETRRARQRNRPHVQMNSAPRRADRSKAARRAEDEEDEAAVSEVRSLLLSLSLFFFQVVVFHRSLCRRAPFGQRIYIHSHRQDEASSSSLSILVGAIRLNVIYPLVLCCCTVLKLNAWLGYGRGRI